MKHITPRNRTVQLTSLVVLVVTLAPLLGSAEATSRSSSDPYRLGIGRTWDHAELLVLIVPPGPHFDRFQGLIVEDDVFLNAVEDSIELWQDAIVDHGSSDISANITFDVRVLGRDAVGPEEFAEVDILITNERQSVMPPFGGVGGFAVMPEAHPCIIGNLPPANYIGAGGASGDWWTFRIAAHEFGHCLGMLHPTNFEPDEDIMSYGRGICVSNLNLLAIHESFGPAFGRTAATHVEVDVNDYERYC